MRLQYIYDGAEIRLEVEQEGEGWRLTLPDGSTRRFEARRLASGDVEVVGGAGWRRFVVGSPGQTVEIALDGSVHRFDPLGSARPAVGPAGSGDVTSPMPGTMVDVLVRVGQHVEAYQALGVVEAMKVMATIEAPFAGIVTEAAAVKGRRVAHGETLFRIAPRAENDAD
jgi:3-methylcrotonyl-CoA carboxylase alpha subunit